MLYVLPLALSDSDYPMLLWAVVIALMALGPALKGWVDVVRWFKGEAIDTSKLATKEELAIATAQSRQELKEAETRLQASQEQALAGVEQRIRTLSEAVDGARGDLREIFNELRSMHRALGRAEGELDALDSKR